MAGELRPGDPAQIGPYRVAGVLGSGGMGRVYLGQTPGGRRVAIKVVRDDLAEDPAFRQRFRHEVASARRVSGLYTALVVDADVDGPVPWLATAYVAGPSLAQEVTRDGTLPAARLRDLAVGLAEGLAAIHAAGVVHRDLKPSNVLLGPDGPVIVDFGISRAAEASALTETGVLIGSPGFMAPEQILNGTDVSPASDVFSLGALLCYAATRRGPFGEGPLQSLVYRAVHGEPDLSGVPDALRPLVARCLAKDPAQRPAPAQILAELTGEPGVGATVAVPVPAVPVALTEEEPAAMAAAAVAAGPATVLGPEEPGAQADGGGPGTVTALPVTQRPRPEPPPGVAPPPRVLESGVSGRGTMGRRRLSRRGRLSLAAIGVAVAAAVPLVIVDLPSAPGLSGPAGPTPAQVRVYAGGSYAFDSPRGVTVDGGHVWVVSPFGLQSAGSLTEMNAATGAWERTLAGNQGIEEPTVIAAAGASVLVGNFTSVSDIDASSGRLIKTLDAGGVPFSGEITAILPVGSSVWVATILQPPSGSSVPPESGTLTEVDLASGKVLRSMSGGDLDRPRGLAFDGTHLWVANAGDRPWNSHGTDNGSVLEVDASTGRVVRAIAGAPAVVGPEGISVYDGHIWVVNAIANSATEFGASDGSLQRTISGKGYAFSHPESITVAGPHAWVPNHDGNSVTEFDALTGTWIRTLSAGSSYSFEAPIAIAVDTARSLAWITSATGGSVGNGFVTELSIG